MLGNCGFVSSVLKNSFFKNFILKKYLEGGKQLHFSCFVSKHTEACLLAFVKLAISIKSVRTEE
jgi:hypothetical protein